MTSVYNETLYPMHGIPIELEGDHMENSKTLISRNNENLLGNIKTEDEHRDTDQTMSTYGENIFDGYDVTIKVEYEPVLEHESKTKATTDSTSSLLHHGHVLNDSTNQNINDDYVFNSSLVQEDSLNILKIPDHNEAVNGLKKYSVHPKRMKEKKVKCNVCSKRFYKNYELKVHFRVHSGEKPFSCTLCDKSFAHKNSLKLHILKHKNERPYKCSVCPKGFTTTTLLKQHMKVHTREPKPRFNSIGVEDRNNLETSVKGENINDDENKTYTPDHSETVGGFKKQGVPSKPPKEKKFKCDTCSKRFLNNYALRVHFRVHSGEKPFSCSLCDKSFAQKNSLDLHILKHKNERPYKCSVCEKAFPMTNALKQHMKIHTGEPRTRPKCCVVEDRNNLQTFSFGEDNAFQNENGMRGSLCGKEFHTEEPIDGEKYEMYISQNSPSTAESSMSDNINVYEQISELKNAAIADEITKALEQHAPLLEPPIPTNVSIIDQNNTVKGSHCQMETTESPKSIYPKPFNCGECNRHFRDKWDLITHMKSHTNELPLLTCKFCEREFRNPKTLKEHLRVHTNERPYKCRKCFAGYKHYDSLRSHIKKHFDHIPDHSEVMEEMRKCGVKEKRVRTEKFKCDVCEREFSKNAILQIHLRIHSGEKPFSCTVCGESFAQKNSLNLHCLKHTKEKPFKCSICQKEYVVKQNFQNHLKVHNGEQRYKCRECGEMFYFWSELSAHRRAHKGDLYKCEICFKGVSTKTDLRFHMRTHSDNQQYQCDICQKIFPTSFGLDAHRSLHSGERPYSCKFCEKTFRVQSSLQKHERIHTGNKFFCDQCDRSFTTKYALTEHARKHNKGFPCYECKQYFSTKAELADHIKSHKVQVIHQCSECRKVLSSISALKEHLKIHTKEQPYECNICQRKFANKYSFQNHQKLHTGDFSIHCEVCGKGLVGKGALTSHMRTHSTERPFVCEVCHYAFKTKHDLKNHRKTQHDIEHL